MARVYSKLLYFVDFKLIVLYGITIYDMFISIAYCSAVTHIGTQFYYLAIFISAK